MSSEIEGAMRRRRSSSTAERLAVTATRNTRQCFSFLSRQQQVKEWIESILGVKLTGTLSESLGDGMMLCRVADAVKNGIISSVLTNTEAKLLAIENLENFLGAIQSLGVQKELCFEPLDLIEAKNMERVVDCIIRFGKIAVRDHDFTPAIIPCNRTDFSEQDIEAAMKLLGLGTNEAPPPKMH